MAICKGCGVTLQSQDPTAIGYTPKEGSEYCQRCFRLMHYDDLTVSMKTGIDPDPILKRIAEMDCFVLWVVDLFDFEASMIPGIQRKLPGKDLLMVAAKRDILPDTLSHEKIARFVFARCKELGVSLKGLVLTSKLKNEGIPEVMEAVRLLSKNRPIVVMGRANAGKSTLLNHLMGKEQFTSSRYPGTTMDFQSIEIEGYTFIDTPGIEVENSILMKVAEKDLKTILPSKMIQPQIYQVHGDQSFAVGGLVRMDVTGCDDATVVWYCGEHLPIHRGKIAAADGLWEKHYGELFSPTPIEKDFVSVTTKKDKSKMDVVIDGLGWVSLQGQISTITIHAPRGVNVTFRKAML